jgi:hypothetical protein
MNGRQWVYLFSASRFFGKKAAYTSIYPESGVDFWDFEHLCSRSAHTGSVICASLLKVMTQQTAFQQRSGIRTG